MARRDRVSLTLENGEENGERKREREGGFSHRKFIGNNWLVGRDPRGSPVLTAIPRPRKELIDLHLKSISP